LAGYTDTSFLATTDTLANRGSDQGACLVLDTKGFQECPDAIDALAFGNRATSQGEIGLIHVDRARVFDNKH
jgi:hypothetical protein